MFQTTNQITILPTILGTPGTINWALEAMRELLGQHGHAGWIHHGQNVKATALRSLGAWVTLGWQKGIYEGYGM